MEPYKTNMEQIGGVFLPDEVIRLAEADGIKWQVAYIFDKQTLYPSIEIDRQHKIHHIVMPEEIRGHEVEYLHDFAHEFGHAALAERIDTIFGAPFTNPDDNTAPNELSADLVNGMQTVVDTWVTDHVMRSNPDLVMTMLSGSLDVGIHADANDYAQMGRDAIFANALAIADCRRHDLLELEPKLAALEHSIKNNTGELGYNLTKNVAGIYANMPRLDGKNHAECIKLLGEYGAKVIGIFNPPFIPKIVIDNDSHNSFYDVSESISVINNVLSGK